jgi:uncharacterized membrane protein
MEPAVTVAVLWLLFAATHVGLGTEPIRARLVARAGEIGFITIFSVVALLSFGLLVGYYATHRAGGAPGPALGAVAALRWPLFAVVTAGVALATAGLVRYPASPTALFGQAIRSPRGIERVTRHPFFAGVALVFLPHVLLAITLAGAVFASGAVLFAIGGAWLQDRKLLARRGAPYAAYVAATSAVPFGAVAGGRQRLVWRELPLGVLGAGVLATFLLRTAHDRIFAHGGAWVIGLLAAGAFVAAMQAHRRARRAGRAGPDARAHSPANATRRSRD